MNGVTPARPLPITIIARAMAADFQSPSPPTVTFRH